MSIGGTPSSLLSLRRWYRATSPIEWSVVPPILRAGPLGDIVRHSEDLLSLLVQQEMVIAKVIPSHVPVEVLGLEIKCKYIRQQSPKRIGNLFNGLAAEAGRCGEGLVRWIGEFGRILFSHIGSSFQMLFLERRA
jgi:hypothetical protein